jgi:hypothetical protein
MQAHRERHRKECRGPAGLRPNDVLRLTASRTGPQTGNVLCRRIKSPAQGSDGRLELRRRAERLAALLRLAWPCYKPPGSAVRESACPTDKPRCRSCRRRSGPRVYSMVSGPPVPACVAEPVSGLAPTTVRACARRSIVLSSHVTPSTDALRRSNRSRTCSPRSSTVGWRTIRSPSSHGGSASFWGPTPGCAFGRHRGPPSTRPLSSLESMAHWAKEGLSSPAQPGRGVAHQLWSATASFPRYAVTRS